VSLLLDPSTHVEVPQAPTLTNDELQNKVDKFVNSKLGVTAEEARQVEVNTTSQENRQVHQCGMMLVNYVLLHHSFITYDS